MSALYMQFSRTTYGPETSRKESGNENTALLDVQRAIPCISLIVETSHDSRIRTLDGEIAAALTLNHNFAGSYWKFLYKFAILHPWKYPGRR
jgi:hypothetical protein